MTDTVDALNADTRVVVAQLRSGAVVQTDEEYIAVGQLYRAGKDREMQIKDYFEGTKAQPGPKAMAHRVWKDLCAKENDALAPLVGPMMQIKCALERYDADKKRKAAEEARRLEVLRQEELARQAEALRTAQPEISPLEEAMAMEAIEESFPVPVALPEARAPKISGVVFRTVIDREKVLAVVGVKGSDHGIPGIAVRCVWEFTVNSLADVPDEYKTRV